jgi:hypothetical protein
VDEPTKTLPLVPSGTSAADDDLDRIKSLPKEVGVLLLIVGIGGLLFPGPIGTPILVMAGVVLWPGVFERVEIGFKRRFPKAHRAGVGSVQRFVSDLERRYPSPH